jgi:uncharacterized protein YwgA
METFRKRKWFQKVVVLAQEMGIPLGYGFGWYRHGPYSSSLANDGFAIEMIMDDSSKKYADMNEYDEVVEGFASLLNCAEKELHELEEPEVVELLASLVFLKNHVYPSPKTKNDLYNALARYKSFTEPQMETAWRILHNRKLI